ncbi:hypothetical protein JB92DRAFT_2832413 [Gautieria morchelliformis]|nr:hypothetical protein JB92DRAFT_2832413 [Gautieria morchelliformis]
MCVSRTAVTEYMRSEVFNNFQDKCAAARRAEGGRVDRFKCLDSGYGGPEAAVAKMLVYRMGRDVGKKDIWKIYEDAAQPLAPPWINAPRARALSRIRGYWIRVESAGQWKHCGVSCGWAKYIVHEEDGRAVAAGRVVGEMENGCSGLGMTKTSHNPGLQLEPGGCIELGTVLVDELTDCTIILRSLVNAAHGDGEEDRRSPSSGEGIAIGAAAARVARRNTRSREHPSPWKLWEIRQVVERKPQATTSNWCWHVKASYVHLQLCFNLLRGAEDKAAAPNPNYNNLTDLSRDQTKDQAFV